MQHKHSLTTAGFTLPNIGGAVTVGIDNTGWMQATYFVHVASAGNFMVVTVRPNEADLYLTDITEGATAGDFITAGVPVYEGAASSVKKPSNPQQATAETISDGGTGASTVSGARDNLQIKRIQIGAATLVAGTVTITAADITSESRVFAMRTADAGGITLRNVRGWKVTGKTTGTPGSFTVSSVGEDGAAVAADVSTFDWMVVG